ncbi:MAG TPA: hypothetical protein VJO35_01770 [Terriglobales bacterium]|nr:hypothetical protein [Terriglobales bacterium]
MKAIIQSLAGVTLYAGMSVGTLAVLLIGARDTWKERGGWRTWPAVVGLICVLAAYAIAWASSIYQWRYGFDFNDPTVRVQFVKLISMIAAVALVIGLFAKGSQRTAILVGSLLVQMYCIFQIDAV